MDDLDVRIANALVGGLGLGTSRFLILLMFNLLGLFDHFQEDSSNSFQGVIVNRLDMTMSMTLNIFFGAYIVGHKVANVSVHCYNMTINQSVFGSFLPPLCIAALIKSFSGQSVRTFQTDHHFMHNWTTVLL